MRQFHELDVTHTCECSRSWDDVRFESARLLENGDLVLVHQCESHGKGNCLHILKAETVRLVQNALKAQHRDQ